MKRISLASIFIGAIISPLAAIASRTCNKIRTVKHILALLLVPNLLLADALTTIAGPVIPMGDSPWSWYDVASQANADVMIPAALDYLPVLGPQLSGTFTLNANGSGSPCGISLTGAGLSGVPAGSYLNGQALIVVWDTVDGAGTGRHYFHVDELAGTTARDTTQCGTGGLIQAQTGTSTPTVTAYWCVAQCFDGIPTYTPVSTPLSGTFDIPKTGYPSCSTNVTLDGAGASGAVVGDWYVASWPTLGARVLFQVASVVGTTITSETACDDWTTPPATGVTVYPCDSTCRTTIQYKYSSSAWAIGGANNGGWLQYDPAMALYYMYLRTSDTDYLTAFRTWTDTIWEWSHDHGTAYGVIQTVPRNAAMKSQFVRILEGGLTDRLEPYYDNFALSLPNAAKQNGTDNRESGYLAMFTAIAAIADTDVTRRAQYCSWLGTIAQGWVDYQTPEGFWPEKNNNFPYQTFGVSPWRMFAITQGLAFAYEAFTDATICPGHSTLAADVLTALEAAGQFMWDYGYSTANRGVYYDVEHPANGLNYSFSTGTVSATVGSATVTGSGTAFTTAFAPCDGTKYIGIDNGGQTWTFPVTACPTNTSLTIGANYGTQELIAARGTTAATNVSNVGYYVAPQNATNCGSMANYCLGTLGGGSTGGLLNGDINSDRDLIWTFGKLYSLTGNAQWKTYGDEVMAVASGGPAGGPGENYDGGMNPCDGPNCTTIENDYIAALPFCGSTVPPGLIPCQSIGSINSPATVGPKRWAQMSGIGGADNYLAWRLGDAVSTARTTSRGLVRFTGGATIH